MSTYNDLDIIKDHSTKLLKKVKVPNVFSTDIRTTKIVTDAVAYEWVNYKLTSLTDTEEVREHDKYYHINSFEELRSKRRSLVSSIVLYQNLVDLESLPSTGRSLRDLMSKTYEILGTHDYVSLVRSVYKDQVLELAETLDRTSHQVLCHGNLCWSNLMTNGNKSLMPTNFEYCAVRDHSWDYASILSMIEDEFSGRDYTYSLYNSILEYIVEYFSDDMTSYYDPLIRPKITTSLYMYDLWTIALLLELGRSPEVISKKLRRVENFETHSSYLISHLVGRLRRSNNE